MQKLFAIKEKLNKKRDLFGLGLISLIAACGGADGAAGGGGKNIPDLEIKGGSKEDKIGIFAHKFLQIGGAANNYDMVIRSPLVDKSDGSSSLNDQGAIYVLWDVADYIGKNKTIDLGNLGGTDGDDDPAADTNGNVAATSGSLAIHGASTNDYIGIFAPEFLQIGGVAGNKLDMVIRSHWVDEGNTGAIYILWNVGDYDGKNKTIDLGNLGDTDRGDDLGLGATSGSLAIYGASTSDYIGYSAPEFLQLGGKDDNYDMVFAGRYLRLVSAPSQEEGVIYILWDIADYYQDANKRIDLDTLGDDTLANNTLADANNDATSGSLAIHGASSYDKIGIKPPEFLQLGGTFGNKLDMVIRSPEVDKAGGSTNEGAIYILWDVSEYADSTSSIDLNKDNISNGATFGSLAIYGAIKEDQIGIHAPEFLQISGKDNNYDMVISSPEVDKAGGSSPFLNNQGAIYILWDVADYYSAGTEANKSIDLAADATSGLLTIYGAATDANLGNILYNAAGELTNIDGDAGGTKDIAFQDSDYTYILFGNKVATTTGTGGATKVTSKTIDLAKVMIALDESYADGNFFSYDFDDSSPYTITARVGYRFAKGTGSDGDEGYTTLAEVQTAYSNVSKLSDVDAGVGVWDIA